MDEKNAGIQESLFLIARNGLYGLINVKGEVVIPCEWDWLCGEFAEGVSVAEKDGKYGFIDYNGNVVFDLNWDEAELFSDGLAKVKKNGKWGYIDRNTGRHAIACDWNYATSFVNGIAFVSSDENKSGYIDKAGNPIGGLKWQMDYEKIEVLVSCNLARVKDDNFKYGCLNKFGELVIPCKWNKLDSFVDGISRVKGDNNKYGYIDTKGNIVIPCKFDFANNFFEGKALTSLYYKQSLEERMFYGYSPDTVWSRFVNKKGDYISDGYQSAYDFSEGFAAVKKNGKWGFINSSGILICACKWEEVRSFKEGMAGVKAKGQWGFINRNGDLVIPCVWESVFDFKEGLAAVEGYGFYETFINKKGEIIGENWQCVGEFENGLAGVHNWDGKEYYINYKGDVVCEAGIRVV